MGKENVYTLSDKELRSLQMILLDMLLEIDRICKKNDIRYCLFAGTMLGAVRHGGFIPWDDDLDVAMTRFEYEKFKKACLQDLDESKYFFSRPHDRPLLSVGICTYPPQRHRICPSGAGAYEDANRGLFGRLPLGRCPEYSPAARAALFSLLYFAEAPVCRGRAQDGQNSLASHMVQLAEHYSA
jgi:hypothetical protein